MGAFVPDHYVQIDIKETKNGFTKGYMYTGQRCVPVFMPEHEYDNLVRDGFFIRDGKEQDSAGLLNTSKTYIPE